MHLFRTESHPAGHRYVIRFHWRENQKISDRMSFRMSVYIRKYRRISLSLAILVYDERENLLGSRSFMQSTMPLLLSTSSNYNLTIFNFSSFSLSLYLITITYTCACLSSTTHQHCWCRWFSWDMDSFPWNWLFIVVVVIMIRITIRALFLTLGENDCSSERKKGIRQERKKVISVIFNYRCR